MRTLSVCFAALLAAVSSYAQVATGTIAGVVEDSSGAVVPQANVSAIHLATGDTRAAVANERGEFTIPYVRIGEYSVSAEASGFRKKTMTGIVLRVDLTVNLRLPLEVGTVAEAVEVSGSAPLVESATSSLGQVIENRKIRELPLNGRNPFALGLLAGNTVPISGMGTNMPFASGGGRFAHNDVLLDGVDNNTVHNNGSIGRNGIAYTPSVDAVEEFKVKTNNFSAEFGRAAGAIVSANIKSGSNQVHGSLWEFVRNEKFDANNFFSNANGVPRQPFKQNQFGFTIGGPVVIPKLYDGHNKTFVFGDYEATRRRTSASSSLLDIPPMDFRRGDFSKYNRPIFDPASRRIGPNGTVISNPFPGNVIPPDRINRSAAAILALLPEPNAGGPGAQARNYLRIAPRGFDNDQFDIKIDHRLSNANTLSARLSQGWSNSPNPGNFDGFIGGGTDTVNNPRSVALSDTHVLSPTTVNEARFGWLYRDNSIVGRGIPDGLEFASQNNVGILDLPQPAFPDIQFSWTGIQASSNQFTGLGGAENNFNYETTYHVSDNLSMQRGAHGFKFGGEVRRYAYDRISGGGGTNYFGPFFSSSSDTANSGAPFADFLFGFQSVVQAGQLIDWARQRDIYAGFYAQDDWKVTPKLTLNLGVRYDLYTQPVDARDRGGYFNRALRRVVIPGEPGFSRAIVNGDHNNFSPRVGIAWAATRRFTMRLGGGVFYARRDQNPEVTMMGTNIPNSPIIAFPETSATSSIVPPANLSNPNVRILPSDPTLSEFTPQNPKGGGFRAPDFYHSETPYNYQWSLDLQYELARDLVMEISYSGSKGNRLVNRVQDNQIRFEDAVAGRNRQADRPIPWINGTNGVDTANGHSIYNAMNVRLEKRYSAGLNFLVNYTWSKLMDSNGSGSSAFSQNGGTTYPLDSYNLWRERALAPLDVPHVFVASYGYELPFGKGKAFASSGPITHVIGGWQINGITYVRSGFPTDIRTSRVPGANMMFANFNVPDVVPGQSLYVPNKGVDGWFNPAAFSEPVQVRAANGAPITMFGNAGRRIGRGPGSTNFDVSLFKNFPIRERISLQFRAEAFNVSNTPTFNLPAATSQALTISNPNFGKLASSSATGRQLQFALKLYF